MAAASATNFKSDPSPDSAANCTADAAVVGDYQGCSLEVVKPNQLKLDLAALGTPGGLEIRVQAAVAGSHPIPAQVALN